MQAHMLVVTSYMLLPNVQFYTVELLITDQKRYATW